MRIDLMFPVLPPALDGIGDYTARLAGALAAEGASVRIWTAQPDAALIPGVEIVRAFRYPPRRGVWELPAALAADPPDWLIVQFNQFSYGRWGLNPLLVPVLRMARRRCPSMRLAVMFHEDFVPPTTWKNRVFRLWQIPQFRALGRLADVVAFSIQPWVARYRSWFPQAHVVHWPVGSNIPDVGCSREEARRRLGLDPETFVVGVFGTIGAGRLVDYIRAAVEHLDRAGVRFVVVYVGPHGRQLRARLPAGVSLRDAGALPGEVVSVHLSAMDLLLAPFVDGASTRRGSMLAGLQHGVAVLSTDGPLTDAMLRAEHGRSLWLVPASDQAAYAEAALQLAGDLERRQALGRHARRFYAAQLDWPVLARRVVEKIDELSCLSVEQ